MAEDFRLFDPNLCIIWAQWRDAMMRFFLTRFVDSVARAVLLIPCLLIGLACATPFPTENLEVGMTAETVRESLPAVGILDMPRFHKFTTSWGLTGVNCSCRLAATISAGC